MPTSLPLAIAPHLRGSWAGRLDDLMDGGQLSGWACSVAPSDARSDAPPDQQAPAQVRLVVEDLLPPAQSWPMAEVAANRYRPELELEGRSAQCGFLVEGPLPLPLPLPFIAIVYCSHRPRHSCVRMHERSVCKYTTTFFLLKLRSVRAVV